MAKSGQKSKRRRPAAAPETFDDWAGSKLNTSLWDNWPEGLIDEIAQVLAMNDSGSHRIGIGDMIERMASVYSVAIGKDTLQKYVRKQLGRSSWSKR